MSGACCGVMLVRLSLPLRGRAMARANRPTALPIAAGACVFLLIRMPISMLESSLPQARLAKQKGGLARSRAGAS